MPKLVNLNRPRSCEAGLPGNRRNAGHFDSDLLTEVDPGHRTPWPAQARVPVDQAMIASLHTFKGWFNAQTKWKCWLGMPGLPDSEGAVRGRPWETEQGMLILIGGLDPQFVFARAEPHGVAPNKDPRVAAWTT